MVCKTSDTEIKLKRINGGSSKIEFLFNYLTHYLQSATFNLATNVVTVAGTPVVRKW